MKESFARPSGDAIWQGVDRLVDRAPTIADIRSHRIELLAARRWRALGRTVPDELVELERTSALHRLVVPRLLERVRDAYDGPMIVHKGPEVAAHYPDPILRDFGDVDLIVRNAEEAQRALIAAGFEEIGDPALYVDIQHLRPLRWPELPLRVEIHSRPKWVSTLAAPRADELFAAAVPSTTTIDGFLALPPEHHALLLAAHSWAHEPMRLLRDVVDIAAVADAADPAGDRSPSTSLGHLPAVGFDPVQRCTQFCQTGAVHCQSVSGLGTSRSPESGQCSRITFSVG